MDESQGCSEFPEQPSLMNCFNWLSEGQESAEQLTAPGEACFVPGRFCTVWIYLYSVSEGGLTRFHTSKPDDDLCTKILPQMGKVLGKDVPGLPMNRSKPTDLLVKPQAGMTVVHFPTTTPEYYGMVDDLVLHEGEAAVDPKYVLQQFIFSAPLETAIAKYKVFASRTPSDKFTFEERVQAWHKSMFGTSSASSSVSVD